MLLVTLMSLHAEEKTMGPQDLLSGLMENNPEIRAARFRFEAATKRPSQAGTLAGAEKEDVHAFIPCL